MNTPICDFVRRYADGGAIRFHMPGHKGKGFLGFESLDITEISGADSLYEARGIIKKSEENASELFGCDTFYSTEGSSLCARASMLLVSLYAKESGEKPTVYAARNSHRSFLTAISLLDIDVEWLESDPSESYLSCTVCPVRLEEMLTRAKKKPTAVYITSPDYTGNMADVKAISEVCRKFGALLVVDNAHGAYLKFLPESLHPIDQGADICFDSAHKTLPVLTGGAYLHISKTAPSMLSEQAKNALSTFGSTSPSYLILQSLDNANAYLADSYRNRLRDFVLKLEKLKDRLKNGGYSLYGNEPMKLTVLAKKYGYTGGELAKLLREKKIECEFHDPDFVVLMPTPESGDDLLRLEEALLSIPQKKAIDQAPPTFHRRESAISVRQALLSPSEELPARDCVGRILASPSVGCPPAVPIVICGEVVDENAVETFLYYGIERCSVVKNRR